ncbi:MAG: creatininase family protein [Bacteroidales bacterium]
MKPQVLQETNWKRVKDEEFKIAILPWGATEAHNYHLPYGTDTILAEKIAADAAGIANNAGAGCIVFPSIAYGVNTGQMEVKLCMNMRPSTQMAIIRDILEVLDKHSIKKLVILNAHGGNAFVPIIRELSLEYPHILMSSINWWVVCKPEGYFTEAGDHAGELETACMQSVAPELVLPLDNAGDGAENKFTIDGFREKWAWTPRRWIYITKDTGVGNPKFATTENGERFLKCCTEKIAKFLIDLSKINNENELYEQ